MFAVFPCFFPRFFLPLCTADRMGKENKIRSLPSRRYEMNLHALGNDAASERQSQIDSVDSALFLTATIIEFVYTRFYHPRGLDSTIMVKYLFCLHSTTF